MMVGLCHTAWRCSAVAALCLLAGCGTPSPHTGQGSDAATSAAGRLRPLTRQPAPPPGAPPQSEVASVRYDLAVSGAAELTPDDGVPGDQAGREVFERGGASWYGLQFHNRLTADGERFDMTALTAAHKTLPFHTRVCVRSLVNGREVLVRINDRGPYANGRIIDLSQAAADAIGMLGVGIKQVALSVIDRGGMRCGGAVVDMADLPTPPEMDRPVAQARRKAAVPHRRRHR